MNYTINDNNLLSPAEVVELSSLPLNLCLEDREYYNSIRTYCAEESKLVQINNLFVNHESLLFKPLFNIIDESFVRKSQSDAFQKSKREKIVFIIKNYLLRFSSTQIDEDIVWFIDNYSQTYFHWITEALPRLFLIYKIDPKITIALPSYYKDMNYVSQSLSCFNGINIKWIENSRKYRLNKVSIPTQAGTPACYHKTLLLEFKNYILNQIISKDNNPYPSRVYISRNKGNKRIVINEDKVLNILSHFGYTTIYNEDLSWQEQIKYAYHAKSIVSIHGAGLTNVLFMESKASVLEFRHDNNNFWDCFYRLSALNEINYYYLKCKVGRKSNIKDYEYHHGDIVVDEVQLSLTLKKMHNHG
ncbi:DUF563 domain-containing protein [Flammeovirga sp. OC4]|uniref:glycosyltransferase family 61 protein n=1 Tax=Flammeovirga sp. OC4 TaxID=1382345 RepID=UPI0005C5380B|nr:glycosyltransferase family 61 protein [Flammeovirga sp. OC4]